MPTETLNNIAMHTLAADGPLLASERDALDLIGEHGDAEVIVAPSASCVAMVRAVSCHWR